MRFMRLRLGLGLTLMTVVVLFGWLAPGAQALDTADLYCGTQTCYEVLGLTQSASDRDIRKAFRSLSLIYHPDKNPSPDAVEVFRSVANAYAVLTENREEYDDLLNDPSKFLQHQWRFYRYQYTHHHTAVWKVVLGAGVLSTLVHWFLWRQRYFSLRRSMLEHPEIQRKMAVERERRLQLLRAALPKPTEKPSRGNKPIRQRGGRKDASVAQQEPSAPGPRLEDDPSLDVALEDVAVMAGWQGRLPVWWRDNLVAQLLVWIPLELLLLLWWHLRWLVRFTLLKQPFGPPELEYITAQTLRISWRRWEGLPAEERAELIERELWKPENMLEWRREMKQAFRRR